MTNDTARKLLAELLSAVDSSNAQAEEHTLCRIRAYLSGFNFQPEATNVEAKQ